MEYIVNITLHEHTFSKAHTSLNAALQTAGAFVENGFNPTIQQKETRK